MEKKKSDVSLIQLLLQYHADSNEFICFRIFNILNHKAQSIRKIDTLNAVLLSGRQNNQQNILEFMQAQIVYAKEGVVSLNGPNV